MTSTGHRIKRPTAGPASVTPAGPSGGDSVAVTGHWHPASDAEEWSVVETAAVFGSVCPSVLQPLRIVHSDVPLSDDPYVRTMQRYAVRMHDWLSTDVQQLQQLLAQPSPLSTVHHVLYQLLQAAIHTGAFQQPLWLFCTRAVTERARVVTAGRCVGRDRIHGNASLLHYDAIQQLALDGAGTEMASSSPPPTETSTGTQHDIAALAQAPYGYPVLVDGVVDCVPSSVQCLLRRTPFPTDAPVLIVVLADGHRMHLTWSVPLYAAILSLDPVGALQRLAVVTDRTLAADLGDDAYRRLAQESEEHTAVLCAQPAFRSLARRLSVIAQRQPSHYGTAVQV